MEIRQIKENDRAALIELVAMMIGDESKEEVAAGIVSDFYTDKHYTTYVIEADGEVVSYLAYKNEAFDGANQVGEIVFLGTRESHRNFGHGQALVQHAEQVARSQGVRKMYIKTSPKNIRAVRFWIQNAYQFEARMRDFSLKNQDAYFLGKDL